MRLITATIARRDQGDAGSNQAASHEPGHPTAGMTDDIAAPVYPQRGSNPHHSNPERGKYPMAIPRLGNGDDNTHPYCVHMPIDRSDRHSINGN